MTIPAAESSKSQEKAFLKTNRILKEQQKETQIILKGLKYLLN